jgi:hypothetical protein
MKWFVFGFLMGFTPFCNGMGLELNKEKLYPTPSGWRAQQESLRDWDHTFSRMTFSVGFHENGHPAVAGYSFIWINGTPFLVQIFWPEEDAVHHYYPWLTYPPK